ncbi:hypothetical protein DMB66_08555 [Actinoplanes sp. ATCC 53533]|nr:hypothetical protein DMB66_08555 [Actinoplanes sp. ATCC 53533]
MMSVRRLVPSTARRMPFRTMVPAVGCHRKPVAERIEVVGRRLRISGIDALSGLGRSAQDMRNPVAVPLETRRRDAQWTPLVRRGVERRSA